MQDDDKGPRFPKIDPTFQSADHVIMTTESPSHRVLHIRGFLGSQFRTKWTLGLLVALVFTSGCRNTQHIACSPGVFEYDSAPKPSEPLEPSLSPPCVSDTIACSTETSGDLSCATVEVPCGTSTGLATQPISFRQDLHDFLGRLGGDAAGMADWQNAALVGAATAGAIAIHQNWDDDVRDYTAEHPKRWGHTSHMIGYFGHAQYHVPALLGLYGWSIKEQDAELHQCATTLISAYTLTSISVLSLKLITDTDRPSDDWNDGRFGFPSYHAASMFTLAAVTDEFHGFATAAPIYTLAGLVSWSRIDERDHDLSDIVFGAFLGWAVGKSVAATRLYGDGRIQLRPYFHPTEPAAGMAIDVPF